MTEEPVSAAAEGEEDRRPAVSFIVPAYNEERELPETLLSIKRAAEEARCSYEIIVVNDGSTDKTAEVACELGARVVEIKRRQIAAARNAGARVSRGGVFVFVDADTHISAVHVKGVLQKLQFGAAGGGAWLCFDREVPGWARAFFLLFTLLYFRLLRLGAGAFLFTTRRNFEKIGGFDENYFAAEEVFFSLALRKMGPFALLRDRVRTSGRKLRLYSGAKILRQLVAMTLRGRGAVTSRASLDLWYGGERESS